MDCLMRCSDEAFLKVVHTFFEGNEGSESFMDFEDCSDDELLSDRVEVVQSIVAYAESLYA